MKTNQIKNLLIQFGEEFTKIVSSPILKKSISEAKENFIYTLPISEDVKFKNLQMAVARPNSKILVFDHNRFLLNFAICLAPGVKIDIMKEDDPRINDKIYNLVI